MGKVLKADASSADAFVQRALYWGVAAGEANFRRGAARYERDDAGRDPNRGDGLRLRIGHVLRG